MLTLFIGKVMKGNIFQKGFQLLYNEYICGVLLRAELGKQANELSLQSDGWRMGEGSERKGNEKGQDSRVAASYTVCRGLLPSKTDTDLMIVSNALF